jgi:hypothetical protein
MHRSGLFLGPHLASWVIADNGPRPERYFRYRHLTFKPSIQIKIQTSVEFSSNLNKWILVQT